MPLAAAGAAYVAALAALGTIPTWGAAAAAVVLAGIAAAVYRARRDKGDLALAAWPALHLLVHLTGALASPLLALPAAWVVALGRLRPRAALAGVAVAAVLVPLLQWIYGAAPALASLARYELLVALAAAYASARSRPPARRAPARVMSDAPSSERHGEGSTSDAEVWRAVLEVARRAAGAHEAALWRADAEWKTAELVGVAAAPGAPEPDPMIPLAGTPYRWAIEEQLPQRVEPGRRELPVAWAAEMLVVPVDLPAGVLALAYPAAAPAEADEAALAAARHLSALAALLRVRAGVEREDARVRAIAEAAQTLPGEIEVDAFARRLAGVVRRGTGAAGAAVALGLDEAGRGSVLHVDDTGPSPRFAAGFGEGESRLALALKHGVDLTYADLPRERDKLPLCTPGEMWLHPPRSAAVFPLVAGEKALGAVVVWHPEPGRFGERETELLRLICTLAPPPLQSARQYQALGERASTDALTGLANRATFSERLAQSGAYFDRYARPFGVLVVDVDFFKRFNDTHGHEAGDRVLQHVASLLRQSVRDVDLPARLGGEEFVVLMPETGLRASAEVAERIRRSIEARAVLWNGNPLSVTASIGAAACPDCTATPGDALKLADEALYRAKAAGRNRVATAPRVGKGGE